MLGSDRRAKRWRRNTAAKNVRGNVKPLACVRVCPPTPPPPRAKLPRGRKNREAGSASRTHLASLCRNWEGSVLRETNAFLISTVFTITGSGWRGVVQLLWSHEPLRDSEEFRGSDGVAGNSSVLASSNYVGLSPWARITRCNFPPRRCKNID